tara:strand:+ start:144 stop:467 length:324 start_codon:yes stop_codon:yes gene_type:complete
MTMTLSTHNDIKTEILADWQQFEDANYPEDILTEYAESAVPIYYSEIIEEWQAMPSEFDDSWQELGTDGSATITTLMQLDLFNYYRDAYLVAFDELAKEKGHEQWDR